MVSGLVHLLWSKLLTWITTLIIYHLLGTAKCFKNYARSSSVPKQWNFRLAAMVRCRSQRPTHVGSCLILSYSWRKQLHQWWEKRFKLKGNSWITSQWLMTRPTTWDLTTRPRRWMHSFSAPRWNVFHPVPTTEGWLFSGHGERSGWAKNASRATGGCLMVRSPESKDVGNHGTIWAQRNSASDWWAQANVQLRTSTFWFTDPLRRSHGNGFKYCRPLGIHCMIRGLNVWGYIYSGERD